MAKNIPLPANWKKLKPHPLGALFPPMGDTEYTALKESMKARGFDTDHPIILHEDKILDGNNRFTAALATKGVEPVFKQYVGTDPLGFVVRENLNRRHLSPSQAAVIAAELAEKMKAQEELDRQEEEKLKEKNKGDKSSANSQSKGKPTKTKRGKGSKAAKAAKVMNVSPRSVAAAAALQKADPGLADDVKSGKTTLHAATVKVEAKKSAADKAGEAYAKAADIIDKNLGEGFTKIIEKKIKSKEILKLSGLEVEEMKRVKPLIEAGWSLAAAMGYKSTQIGISHPIRTLVDRTLANNAGAFSLTVEAYGKKFQIDTVAVD